ncbi:MAG: ABC transporter ATP-binding protein [Chloroflexi bacterium]|nr:ABC transporter ATP-binding protein [Chloroflexota bacterium]
MPPFLFMDRITKTFPGVVANNEVTLEVKQGAIHALLGENGAGKTTLMNVLYGLYQPDAGRIHLRGEVVRFDSPSDAIAHGIGMVHQHFMLVSAFTAAENIVLGLPSAHPPRLDLRAAGKRIAELSATYGLEVEPGACVWQLPVGAQQRVEIIKALYRGADLLILDEPTAVLTPGEASDLFRILRRLAVEGHTIIFISHKLNEVMDVSDRVTVLRDGRVVTTIETARTSPRELAQMMVGRPVLMEFERAEAQSGEAVLHVENLTALSDRALPALRDVSFEVRRGEILSIAGVDGNGQSELAEVLSGVRRPTAGRVRLLGHDLTGASPRAVIEANAGYIPADRRAAGLVTDFTLAENFILKSFADAPFCRWGWLDLQAIERHAGRLLRDFDIRAPSARVPARQLSGGNQQKVVLARELSRRPGVLIASQPTRGLDVGATEYVLRNLLAQRARGAGILFISTELEEILAVSDHIAVLYEGEIMGIVPGPGADAHEIGLMMAGARRSAPLARGHA